VTAVPLAGRADEQDKDASSHDRDPQA